MRKYRSSRSRPSLHRRLGIDVGRADQPEVHLDEAIAADRPVLALLQHAQQLGLQQQRHLADLVEHQRAAGGQLEQADLVAGRAGERALLVAEQLRLDQLLRQRRAVDLDERALRAAAAHVDRVGDQLLADAVLALDQDVGVALGHRLDQLEQLAHLLALADDVRERVLIAHLLLQPLVLRALDLQVGRAIEDRDDAGGIEIRFFEEEERAGLAGFERARDRADAADHDHLRRVVDRLQLAQQRDAVDVGQHQIEQHHVGPPRAEQFYRARADQRGAHFVAGRAAALLDHHLQPVGDHRLVVDDEDAAAVCRLHRRHICRPIMDV